MKEDENLYFLKSFPKEENGLFIVYDLFTFDNLFRSLLKNGFDHEECSFFILANCSLSAIIFQERIHNHKYRSLSSKDAISPDLAAVKAKVIQDLLTITRSN